MNRSIQPLQLTGCTPEPLLAYLKAMGVFRLVAEQKDPMARGAWSTGATFVLHSSLDREALLGFFMKEYQPTPMVAPWNGGSGFYPKDNHAAIDSIRQSEDPRLQPYRQAVDSAHRILKDLQLNQAPSQAKDRALKALLLTCCRNAMPESSLHWLDAAYVLTTDGPRYPPLLGTGGNDGRLEFTNNFMQNLLLALADTGSEPGKSRRRGREAANPVEWLSEALFGDTSSALTNGPVGQFNPGGAGGPNATAGFEGSSLTNPWDYVLMMEGALFFAGAVARRLSAGSRGRAVFPFTVETAAAGYGTAVNAENTSDGSRAEMWVPLWERPATYREVGHLFREGRAQLGTRQAATGVDFARAVVGLGVERGITGFQRFGFLKRNGLAFIAAPLGHFRVTPKPESNLLFDLDPWLERLRSATRGRSAPAGLTGAVRGIDQAILEYCAHGGAPLLQEVLLAAGRAERWLAASRLRDSIRPLGGLNPDWLRQCDDGSPEFRLAAALASIQGAGGVGPIRANLEPVTLQRGRWRWAEDDTSVAWHEGDIPRSLAAVLERRCLEARMKVGVPDAVIGDGPDRLTNLPLPHRVSSPLADIHAFVEGRVNHDKIADLLLPLTAINWQSQVNFGINARTPMPPTMPRLYATLKLLFLPSAFQRNEGAERIRIPPEPSILPLLRGGRPHDAYPVACRRLVASGLTPLARDLDVPQNWGDSLAASLLIPLHHRDVYRLADIALMPESDAH